MDPPELPSATQPLPRPSDRLQRLFRDRRSTREFASKALSARELGTVFGALGDSSSCSAG